MVPGRCRCGVAVFAASGIDLFEVHRLSRPLRSEVTIDDSPFIEPLTALPGDDSYCVLLVNRQIARILCGNGEGMREVVSIVPEAASLGDNERMQVTPTDARIETHAIHDGVDRCKTELIKIKLLPSSSRAVGMQPMKRFRTTQRLYPSFTRRVRRWTRSPRRFHIVVRSRELLVA